MVGESLLPLLRNAGKQVIAFSRRRLNQVEDGIAWHSPIADPGVGDVIPNWVCLAPIWTLPDYFSLLERCGARRVVALSSTSRFSKYESNNLAERALAQRLEDAEARLRTWAEGRHIEWTILRPTLIYGRGRDKNLSEIARLIRRFGFFPLLGQGLGLRQPIHVRDVAAACYLALSNANTRNRDYNISGAETLPYREMVSRVFAALGRRPRFLVVPLGIFKLALIVLKLLPRYRHWSVAMAERMNRDLVFDHSDAVKEWGYSPQQFQLTAEDFAERC